MGLRPCCFQAQPEFRCVLASKQEQEQERENKLAFVVLLWVELVMIGAFGKD